MPLPNSISMYNIGNEEKVYLSDFESADGTIWIKEILSSDKRIAAKQILNEIECIPKGKRMIMVFENYE